MAERPFILEPAMRRIVICAIEDHALWRLWRIDTLHVLSNHVHIVVAAPGYKPEVVVGQFKSWATRRLREHGMLKGRTHVWTKMASTRYINDEASRLVAVDYVKNHQ